MSAATQQPSQPLLDAGPLPTKAMRDDSRKQLVDALDSRRGKKVLVLDPLLSGPLGLITEVQMLKEHGVEQLVHLGPEAISSDVRNVLFFVRPTIQNAQLVARQVRATLDAAARQQPGGSQPLEHSVFFVPRRTTACSRILEEEGVLGDVTIGEFPLDLIPFEPDVLSLELSSVFRDTVVDGDPSSHYYVARALAKLEALVGTIPRIAGKGNAAGSVFSLMQRLRRDVGVVNTRDAMKPKVEGLILLDRQADLLTPMCTQLTYEGLLDEVLRIHNSAVEMDGSNPAAVAGVKRSKIPLNSSDSLFRSIRDANFASVGPTLKERALSLQADYQDLTPDTKTVGQMKDFVKKLNTLPELNRHTHIADVLSQATRKPEFAAKLKIEQSLLDGYSIDSVADDIEEMMFQMEDPWIVLRLLCLASFTQGGIPPKRFDSLRREFLLSYGHEQMLLLSSLQRANILRRQDTTKPVYAPLKARLNLIKDDMSESNPQDISYTYSGYAPLSCRLVESVLQGGWRSCDEALKLIPGPKFDYAQTWDAAGMPTVRPVEGQPLLSPASTTSTDGKDRTIMVAFIGGITFAEISALRFIGRQRGVNVVIVTTKLINGTTLLESFQSDALKLSGASKQAP